MQGRLMTVNRGLFLLAFIWGATGLLNPAWSQDTQQPDAAVEEEAEETSEKAAPEKEAEAPPEKPETNKAESSKEQKKTKKNSESDEEESEADEGKGEVDTDRFKPSSREFTFETPAKPVILFFEISGPIDLGLAPFIQRVVKEAENREDVVAIVTEINTPGGRVDAAVQIKNALLESSIPTIAWVHSEAISAGALISYAHDGIFFSTGGTIGAATPIQMAPGGGAQAVGEKVVSYMRGVMRATAEANDRDGELAEAMVDASIAIPGIIKKDKLVTLTAEEAIRWGVGDGKASSRAELLENLGLADASIEKRETNWAEEIARILTGPTVSGLLMAIGMLGLFLEFSTPGFGIPGIVGLLSFLLFFVGHFVVHLAGAEEMALLGFGMILLVLEIFVIPGFGIAGVAGLAAIATALVMMMIALPIEVSWEIGELGDAISRVSIAFAATIALAFILFKFLPRTKAVSRLVLETAMSGDEGFESFDTSSRSTLVGQEGVVAMDLRPSGKVRVNEELLDVVSEGGFIGKGTPIKIVKTEGARIVVRALVNPEGDSP